MNAAAQTALIHAAELLEEDARRLSYLLYSKCLFQPYGTRWEDDQKVKSEYDDTLTTALELRLLAKRINDGQIAVSPAPTFEGK